MSGKLIVFEGSDGSGKSTQFRMLCDWMDQERVPYERLIFPRYQEPSSALIRMYLSGEFGSRPEDVNAYAASAFYAVDRYASWKQDWGRAYRAGALVLADRYTTSNAIHQACKLPESEWDAFFHWLSDFEYRRLGLPEPDMVLWMDMPTERSVELLRRREDATGTRADIHEVDAEYLRMCRRAAARACEFFGWQRIPCTDDRGELLSPEQIQEQIRSLVSRAGQ